MPLGKPSGYSVLESQQGMPATYGDWEKRLPSLCAFLCDVTWADGSTRAPGKLTLWTADALWKGCLADQVASVVSFLSAQDPSGLLQAMEKGLREDKLDWRRSVPFGAKRTTKR
jgi:hypothetical protein